MQKCFVINIQVCETNLNCGIALSPDIGIDKPLSPLSNDIGIDKFTSAM